MPEPARFPWEFRRISPPAMVNAGRAAVTRGSGLVGAESPPQIAPGDIRREIEGADRLIDAYDRRRRWADQLAGCTVVSVASAGSAGRTRPIARYKPYPSATPSDVDDHVVDVGDAVWRADEQREAELHGLEGERDREACRDDRDQGSPARPEDRQEDPERGEREHVAHQDPSRLPVEPVAKGDTDRFERHDVDPRERPRPVAGQALFRQPDPRRERERREQQPDEDDDVRPRRRAVRATATYRSGRADSSTPRAA